MSGLFSALSLKGVSFENRVVMPPMATNMATEDGQVTEQILKHYEERAASRVGTIIVEHSYMRPDGRVNDRQMGVHSDEVIPGLCELAEGIQKHNCRAIIQITHAGASSKGDASGTVWGAGSKPRPGSDQIPSPMSPEQLKEIIRKFVEGARRCVQAGFDGVQLHGAHGYLLNQFLSPLTNDRDDSFGGTLQNRSSFPLQVVQAVREEIGQEALLYYRLGADDLIDGGLTVEETAPFSELLVDNGVDVVDVSGGLGGARPSGETGEAYFLPQAKAIKKTIGDEAAVLVTGGIVNATTANRVVSEKGLDFVGIGRALLRDPYWAVKAADALEEME